MLLKKNAELLRMPIALLRPSKMCREHTCRSTLLGARVAPSSRADVVCTAARLADAMFANRKLGWIEGSHIDREEFETARAPPNIATKCVPVIRNPRLPMQSRERRRQINSRKLIALALTVLRSSTSVDQLLPTYVERSGAVFPLPIVVGAWPPTFWQLLILQYSRIQKR